MMLRTIDADAPIRKEVSRRRSRSVVQVLVYLACRLVRHASRWTLSFGRNCLWLKPWRRVYLRFAPAYGVKPVWRDQRGGDVSKDCSS